MKYHIILRSICIESTLISGSKCATEVILIETDEESGYTMSNGMNTIDVVDTCCGIEVTNRTILWVSAITFTLFVSAEIVGAFAANSLSLLGDAAAMSVDVFTVSIVINISLLINIYKRCVCLSQYFCNLYAEHVKDKRGKLDESTRMMLEVYIPTFSVCALIGVSVYITWEAITVILDPPEEDDVNVYIMFGFAVANMLIDLLSVFLFCVRGSKVLYQKNVHTFSTDATAPRHIEFLKAHEERMQSIGMSKESGLNLNMMSALIHVSGDTLRTFAIFFSALISSTSNISGDVADAWAAVIVTITIFGIVIPLIKEIFLAFKKHFE